jgi:oligopeptidase B
LSLQEEKKLCMPLMPYALLCWAVLSCRWHAAGRQLNKHHSVTDLLAVLQHLMQLRVTAPGLIAGHAASAGCLTLAAAINARPEWFCAAVLEAPFVDWVSGTGAVDGQGQPLVGDHLLTHHETDEWGDPWSDQAVAELVTQLCPYTNLAPGVRYPAVLLTAGLQDTRVPWWMPVKYAAKLRQLQQTSGRSRSRSLASGDSGSEAGGSVDQGAADVLLQFDDEGSHFSMGLSGGILQDAALQQAFLCTYVPCQ